MREAYLFSVILSISCRFHIFRRLQSWVDKSNSHWGRRRDGTWVLLGWVGSGRAVWIEHTRFHGSFLSSCITLSLKCTPWLISSATSCLLLTRLISRVPCRIIVSARSPVSPTVAPSLVHSYSFIPSSGTVPQILLTLFPLKLPLRRSTRFWFSFFIILSLVVSCGILNSCG